MLREMPKLLWGCYSVADHLGPRPFVADLILYDRLVIPTPADDDRERWEHNGWNPDKLDRLLGILGPFAERIEWSYDLRNGWEESYRGSPSQSTELAADVRPSAFQASRMVLSDHLAERAQSEVGTIINAKDVVDVRGVAVFGSPDRFDRQWRWTWVRPFPRRDVVVKPGEIWEAGAPLPPMPEERAKVVVTRLAVPDDKSSSDEEVLKRTVDYVSRRDVRENRAQLHEIIGWLDEEGASTETMVKEMTWLIEALNETARTKAKAERARMVVQAGTVAMGLIAMNAPWVTAPQGLAVAGAEAFIQRRWQADEEAPGLRAAALLDEAKRALT